MLEWHVPVPLINCTQWQIYLSLPNSSCKASHQESLSEGRRDGCRWTLEDQGSAQTVSKQLELSKVTLMKILSFAKTNPKSPVSKRMSGRGQLLKYISIQLWISIFFLIFLLVLIFLVFCGWGLIFFRHQHSLTDAGKPLFNSIISY